jgi:PIN domain nuclease of toxin-antitoxin system
MRAYILDSSALLRYIDGEAGAERVEAILADCIGFRTEARISSVQWGEIAGKLRTYHGPQQEERIMSSLLPSELQIVPVTAERAVHAAHLRVDRKISYADAFALELAIQSPDHVLVTADFGFKAVDDLAKIEFLPPKQGNPAPINVSSLPRSAQ